MLKLTSFLPSPKLKPYVQRYILTEGCIPQGEALNHLLIPGLTEIVYFNLQDDRQVFTSREEVSLRHGLFSGQLTEAFSGQFSGRVKIIGAHLHTPALYQLFQVPMQEFLNRSVLLEDMLGQRAVDFCDQLREEKSVGGVIKRIETFLISRLNEIRYPIHNVLHNSLAVMPAALHTAPVQQMAKYNKVSTRTLQKVFAHQTGLTPKEYCRMFRFNEVIKMINANPFNWHRVVERLGYYDQAHFLNDFKLVTGHSPTRYLPQHAGVNEFITDYKHR